MEDAPTRSYARHYAEERLLQASPDAVYAVLDDHARLSEHMAKRGWRTLGSSMTLTMDETRGRRVGSKLHMEGRILGIRLELDEVVTCREPPRRKAWETVGVPRLLVIGHYRMRVDIEPSSIGSRVRIAIDHELPLRKAWLGRLLGPAYARWCVGELARTLEGHVATPQGAPGPRPARKAK